MLDNREKRELKKKYYSKNSASQVLGCLLKDSDLLLDTTKPLEISDFTEPFHEYIFEAIYWLKEDGMKDIDVNEIREYLQRDDGKKYKTVFEINKGNQLIVDMEQHANTANYKYHYNKIRKLSLLRDMIDEDIDVTPVLDKQKRLERSVREEQELTFDEWSLNEIIDKLLDTKSMHFKTEYCHYNSNQYEMLGSDIEGTLAHIKRGEVYGKLGQGTISNAVTLGALRTKFEIHSAGTGVGGLI